MKTPDEIKKALECCSDVNAPCKICPFYIATSAECIIHMADCAYEYIQKLEYKIGELTEMVEQLEEAQPKWISVEEMLPDDCIDVLVFTRSGYTSSISIAHALKGRWFSKGIPVETVTHWMPLPEPPKEDA